MTQMDRGEEAATGAAKATALERAAAAVIVDPSFVRSPALTRLLRYLVDAASRGEGQTLNSYSVAVDGMGRDADYDAQSDAYARVLVTRLRKALDAYYARAGVGEHQRLVIESGSYEIRLVAVGDSEAPAVERAPIGPGAIGPAATGSVVIGPTPTGPGPTRPGFPKGGWAWAALVVCLIAAVGVILQWRANTQADTARWRTSNFPTVKVDVIDESGMRSGGDLARHMQQSMMINIDNYEGIRVLYDHSAQENYKIKVTIRPKDGSYYRNVMLIDNISNRLLWSDMDVYNNDSTGNYPLIDNRLARSIFYITHISGAIHSYERKRNYDANNPYGCWLRFAALLQNNHTISDAAFSQCAKDWFSAAPNHPMAAGLYGWALTDAAASKFTDSAREAALQQAMALLESNSATNPNSPLLGVAKMRVYAFVGDHAALRAAANHAVALNRHNLDILGVAGLMLTLHNDPKGEVLLNQAIGQHFNPPAWYIVGPFVSAMMRDRPEDARKSLVGLKEFRHSLPILAVLSAAYHGRVGNTQRARSEWHRAAQTYPILNRDPDMFFSRLPIGPAVRARLQEWLAPVLQNKRG